jgi:type II secretory pathway component PulF
MWQPLIEVAFLVIYAALLTAVVPYVDKDSGRYGTLIPGGLSLAIGAVVGMSDTDGWIWSITMILMPVGLALTLRRYGNLREAGKLDFVDNALGAKN